MKRWGQSVLIMAAAAALTCMPATFGAAQADPAPYVPTPGVESKYFAAGPSAVTERLGIGCCDAAGAKYDVWYPSELESSPGRHPIVLWGNGTNAVPSQYTSLLRHLASWGFVVIGTENKNTGSGAEIRQSLDWLLGREGDPSSVFHGKLDRAQVGAVGHSQGATGVLNALRDAGGAVKTAVPLELPAQLLCSSGRSCTDTRALTGGSVFFINGSRDGISPSEQLVPWQVAGLHSNRAYYEATPGQVPKVWATYNGADHNDPQGQPGCTEASNPCAVGVFGYLGYPTAWLRAQLAGDGAARAAFRAGGELFAPSPNWSNQVGTLWG